MFERPIKVT